MAKKKGDKKKKKKGVLSSILTCLSSLLCCVSSSAEDEHIEQAKDTPEQAKDTSEQPSTTPVEKSSAPPFSPQDEHPCETLGDLLCPSRLPSLLLVKPAVNTYSETVATKHAGNKAGDYRQTVSDTFLLSHVEHHSPSWPALSSVRASFHQGSSAWLESSWVGNQCTTMSLVAVTLSTIVSVDTWEQDELDFILFSGDKNHGSILADLGRIADPIQRVGIYELAGRRVIISLGSHHFTMEGCAETDGMGVVSAIDPHAEPMREYGMVSLTEALQRALYNTDGAVLTVGDYSMAVIPDPEGGLRVWDSHSRGPGGMFHPDGRAILTLVENFSDLEELLRLQILQRGCPAEQFEVLGFQRVLGGT